MGLDGSTGVSAYAPVRAASLAAMAGLASSTCQAIRAGKPNATSPQALHQGKRDGQVRCQAEQRAYDDVAALGHAKGAGDGEACCPDGLAQRLDGQSLREACIRA